MREQIKEKCVPLNETNIGSGEFDNESYIIIINHAKLASSFWL